MSARREHEKEVQDKDQGNHWQAAEGRGSHMRAQATSRDRKNVADKKDEDHQGNRDKGKEKEPAWAETSIPGSIGLPRTADVEMDAVQAWEREKEGPKQDTAGQAELQMDEIQLFKMLLEHEADKMLEQEVGLGENDRASASSE